MVALRLIIGIFALLLGIAWPAGGHSALAGTSQVLFGLDSGKLVTIDASTGATALVGPTGYFTVSGLALAPSGMLFAVTADPTGPPQLLQIDPATGLGSPVGQASFELGGISGMAFAPSGVLYGVTFANDLVTIDTMTAAMTRVGSTGLAGPAHIQSIAVDQSGRLFGSTFDPGDLTQGIPPGPTRLITLDPLTGLATDGLAFVPQASVSGIAFDAADRLLGVTCDVSPQLVQIDPETAALTIIGSLVGPVTCVGDIAFGQAAALQVSVVIKPGDPTAAINLKSMGLIPVAILSGGSFDATAVEPTSVRFGPNGAQVPTGHSHAEDANGDGRPDLMLAFRTAESGIACGAAEVSLTGTTRSGQAIAGSAPIRTVAC